METFRLFVGGLLLKEAVRAAAFCSFGFIQQGLSNEEMMLAIALFLRQL